MIRTKHICPRCGGNLLADMLDGTNCLQCGWVPGAPVNLPLVNLKSISANRPTWRESPSLGAALRNGRKHGWHHPNPAGQSIRFRGDKL